MASDEQSENPYAPPASLAKPPKADPDELHDMLERAFFAATYGTFFLPGVGYLISIFLLIKARERREEFTPTHQQLFNTTAMICRVLLILLLGAVVIIAGENAFQWSNHLRIH